MPKAFAFDQWFSTARMGAATALSAVMLVACTTTTPAPTSYPGGPVAERPDRPDPVQQPAPQPKDKDVVEVDVVKDVETPDVETPEDVAGFDPSAPYYNNRGGLTPPHMQGRDIKRLALLLPFSSDRDVLREEAASMYRAAELSVFERDTPDVLLIALDTKGTKDGAKSATRAAIKAGADVILGPIIANNVRASADEARRSGTPLLAFSNDQTVAGNGTYLVSFPPEAEVARIVEYVSAQGTNRFAFLGPEGVYGRRVKRAYEEAVRNNGGQITAAETYNGNDISVMQTPAQSLARFYAEGETAARSNGGVTPMSYEAILLPEGGTPLRSLAPLLPYYEVDPSRVQFMGTSRWDNEDTVREPALAGGIFAGPDKDARKAFEANYDRSYGDEPSSLAPLAYDAVMFGAYIADGDPKGRRFRAEDPKGFYGTGGLISFDADGRPQRGLAVYTIQNGRFILLDPAPRTAGTTLGQ